MLIITICYIIGIIMGLYLKINIALLLFTIIGILVINCFLQMKMRQIEDDEQHINHEKKSIDKIILIIGFIMIIISFFIVRSKENKISDICNSINKNAQFTGVVVDIDRDDKYYNNYIISIKTLNESNSINTDIDTVKNNTVKNDTAKNNTIKNNTIKNNNIKYTKEKELITGKNKYKNTKIILKTKKNNSNLEYGDLILGIGDFEKPSIRKNYKGFDYSDYLKQENIYLICKSNMNDIKIIAKKSLPMYKMWINTLKNRFEDNISAILPRENAGIANALLLGDSKYIEKKQKQRFSDASLSHILAISGMHVGLAISTLSVLLKKFDNRKGKYILILFLIFFMELTGCLPSVIRAVIMSIIAIISKLVYRKSDTLNNICISCLIILIINPYYILNIGFQLSFLGTLGIVLFYERLNSIICKFKVKIGIIKKTILLSISANILIFPILVYSFNSISLVFLLSNILVLPLLAIMCVTGYLTIIVSLISTNSSKIIGIVFNYCVTLFKIIADYCSKITLLRTNIITPNLFYIIIYYVFIFYIFFIYKNSHKKYLKKIFIFISIFLIIINIFSNYKKGLNIYFIDVGQGDSTLIITEKNKKILIDGGGSESSSFDVGENVLVPYLFDRKVMTIDYMIISHFDSDHCKGLFTVMDKLNVKNVIISRQGKVSENYKTFLSIVKEKKVNVIYIKAGDKLNIDKSTYMDFLWPQEAQIQENILNNNSIVCKLHYKNFSILFTGDIEKIAEEKLVQKYDKRILNSTVLKVAHHGSKSSSTQNIVDLINPKVVLIGVGEKNNFGHPDYNVIQRFENIGARVYRTDTDGEIAIEVSKTGNVKIHKFVMY